jgi:hypothetical protein
VATTMETKQNAAVDLTADGDAAAAAVAEF